MFHQGIYPTILIVLVNFKKTHFDNDFATAAQKPPVIPTRARLSMRDRGSDTLVSTGPFSGSLRVGSWSDVEFRAGSERTWKPEVNDDVVDIV